MDRLPEGIRHVTPFVALRVFEGSGVNEEIRRLLEETMKSWRMELTCAQDVLGEVKIMRGIFQGDSLSPLYDLKLYRKNEKEVDSLIHTV